MVKLNIKPSGPRTYQASEGFGPSSKRIFVPSVTEVLTVASDKTWMNRVLMKHGRRELDRRRDDAAELGVRVHSVARAVCQDNNHVPEEPEMIPFAEAVGEFLAVHVAEVIATEMPLASARLRFGGTLDLLARLHDGSIAVCDWKTTTGSLTRVHGLQTVMYAMLLKDAGYTVNRRIVIRLHKGEKAGKWYARSFENHEEDVTAARASVALWWWLHGSRLKDVDGTPMGEKGA